MEKLINEIKESFRSKFNCSEFKIIGFFYEGFLRCYVESIGIIKDFEISKYHIIGIYDFINTEQEIQKRNKKDNKVIVSISILDDFVIDYSFDDQFASEHFNYRNS